MKLLLIRRLMSRITLGILLCLCVMAMSTVAIVAQEPLMPQVGNVLEGTISILHVDPAPGANISYQAIPFMNTTNNQQVNLQMPVMQAQQYVNQRVRITGSPVISNTTQSGSPTTYTVDSITSLESADSDSNNGAFGVQEFPITGTKNNVNILCSFNDTDHDFIAPYNQFTYFDTLMSGTEPGLAHYFDELSSTQYGSNNNWVTMNTTTINQWFEMSVSSANFSTVGDATALANACLNAANPSVNFASFSGINFIFDANYAQFALGTSGQTFNVDGVRTYRTTWNPIFSWIDQYFIGHEIGHTFNMLHTAGHESAARFPYDNRWDIMSGGGEDDARTDPTIGGIAPSTSAINMLYAGWIPNGRYREVAIGQYAQIQIDSLDLPVGTTSVLVVDIPYGTFDTTYQDFVTFYTVEVHYQRGYDAHQLFSGVLIYDINYYNYNATDAVGQIEGNDGNTNVNDAGSAWTVGETFHDAVNNITISVLATDGTSTFTVAVSNNSAPVPATNLASNLDTYTSTPAEPTLSWNHDGYATDGYWVRVDLSGKPSQWDYYSRASVCSGSSCSVAMNTAAIVRNDQYQWTVYAAGPGGGTYAVAPDNFTVNLAAPTPREVVVGGNLTTPPLAPTYSWPHDGVTSHYNLIVERGTTAIHNGWYQSSAICTGGTCTVAPSIAYQNGNHRARVGTWSEFFGTGAFGSYTNFAINVPPSLATNILVDGQTLPTTVNALPVDPQITWTHDGVTEWYNIYLGGPNTIVSKWFTRAELNCTTTCTLNTPLVGGATYLNGAYSVWIQGWNSVSGTGAWASGNFTVGIAAPTSPQNNRFVNLADDDRPVFTWDYDGVSTWFNVVISTTGRTVINRWIPATELGCASVCTLNLPAGITLWDGEYAWWMQAVSLGGTSGWTNHPFTINALDIYVGYSAQNPAITFDYDGVTTWFNFWIGGPTTVYSTWISAVNLGCTSTCTLVTNANLYQNGAYAAWIQAYSPTNGTSAWVSENFTFPIPAP